MRKGPRSVFPVIAACLLLAIECRPVAPGPGIEYGFATEREREISAVFRRHTGRVEVYRGYLNVFSARALYLSREVTEAAVDWEADSRLLSPEAKERIYRLASPEDERCIRFLVAFYARGNGVSLEHPDSPWQIRMVGPDGRYVEADRISTADKVGPIYLRFLPWDLSWSKLYLVCFPPTEGEADPDGRGVDLLFTGPDGRGGMHIMTRSHPEDSGP